MAGKIEEGCGSSGLAVLIGNLRQDVDSTQLKTQLIQLLQRRMVQVCHPGNIFGSCPLIHHAELFFAVYACARILGKSAHGVKVIGRAGKWLRKNVDFLKVFKNKT